MTNVGNEDFPWIIEAVVFNSSNTVLKTTLQTEAKLETDGYVRFKNLAVSEQADYFNLKYQFKLPTGLKPATFNPLTLESPKQSTSVKASLTCKTKEENQIINENEKFNISISIIDELTEAVVKNISWKNQIWNVSIGMVSLSSCQSSGQLKLDLFTAVVNLTEGVFKINNLYITKSGMYLLAISLKSSLNDYSLSCVSKSILVKQQTTNIAIDDETLPSLYFRFNGTFSNYKSKTELFKAMFHNCIFEKFNLVPTRTHAVYEGSIMISSSAKGTPSNLAQMKSLISSGGFALDSNIKLLSATLFDKEYVFISDTGSSVNSGSIVQIAQQQQAKNEQVIFKKYKKNLISFF